MDTFLIQEAQTMEGTYGDGLCFLMTLEKDLQTTFDSLSNTEKCERLDVKDLLRESSNPSKGDYCLSLKSISVVSFNTYKNKLCDNLKEIKYICLSSVDDNKNIFLSLNRSVVFRCVLYQAAKHKENYGMMKLNQSYFIIVNNKEMKDCNALRVALLSDHLISFLTVNGAKVLASDFCKYSELFFNDFSVLCTDDCIGNIRNVSELIVNTSRTCEWREDVGGKRNFIDINGGHYIEARSLSTRFGNDVGQIKIFDAESDIIQKSAYIVHFFYFHGASCDIIVHINLQGQKQKIMKSGCLVEMLDLTDSPQIFVNCQDVQFKSQTDINVKTYVDCVKRDIKKAMSHKCDSGVLNTEMMTILVETAVKFTFLKAGTNAPLTVDIFCDHNSNKSDGIFIQYNFARLCNLLRKFDFNVQNGYYRELPALHEIDFGLLREKEEWDLLKFVLHFPRLVQDIFHSINSKHNFLSNRICIMLTKLCHSFSLYYSRVRILSSPQPQLQKTMHARMWLVKGVYQVMCNSFALINVRGLNQM